MLTRRDQGRLVELAYASVEAPESWRLFLRELIALFSGVAASILLRPRGSTAEPFLLHEGYPQGSIESYPALHAAEKLWSRIEHVVPVGAVFAIEDHIPFAELAGTTFYKDWCVRYGLGAVYGLKLFDDSDGYGLLYLECSRERAGGLDAALRTTLARVFPHVQRALQLSGLVNETREAALRDLVATCRVPAVIIDSERVVVATNDGAERLLREGCLKRNSVTGQLALSDGADTRRLMEILRSLSSSVGAAPQVGTLNLRTPFEEDDISVLEISGLRSRMGRRGDVAARFRSEQRQCFLIRVRSRSRLSPPPSETLMAALRLTELEAEAVTALLRGETVEEQAAARGVKIDAIRWHFRNIYSKFGCRSQAELVCIILGLLGS